MRRRLAVAAGELEVLELPGDSRQPALVLLHEGLGSVGLWRDFPRLLARATGRRTIAFSRYGHGESDPPPSPRTPSFMHEEALDVLPVLLAQLQLRAPVLVGHSDGASIALIHAARHDVSGVVAIAPHVFVEQLCLEQIRRARERYLSGELRARMARHHRDPDVAFFGWNDVWLDPDFLGWRIAEVIPAISRPMLLIQGERDEYGTMAQLDAIERAANVPVTRVHLDCGHSPPSERSRETVEAIRSWLDRTERRRGPSS